MLKGKLVEVMHLNISCKVEWHSFIAPQGTCRFGLVPASATGSQTSTAATVVRPENSDAYQAKDVTYALN